MARRSGGNLHADPDHLWRIRFAPQAIPWLVGLTITAAYWFTSSTSFANPAVTLARGFTATFAGIAINHVPAFVVAQIVGAVVAALAGALLFRWRRRRPRPRASLRKRWRISNVNFFASYL